MPDWGSQGGPNAGNGPNAGRKIVLCLIVAFVLGVILIKLGVFG